MSFSRTHNLGMVFLLVIFVLTPSLIQLANSSQVLNTGTVLFTNMDSLACCIETERYATLVFRQLLTNVISVPLRQAKGDAYVVAFVTFVHASARKVVTCTPPVVARSFVLALFDTVGGYLRTYLLPVSVEGFYAGNVRFNEVRKLFNLYNDIKDYLHTNGKGWMPPIKKYGVNHKVRSLTMEKTCEDETEACENFLISLGDNTSSVMPIPFLDDNAKPRSIALPLRYGALHNIESFESAYLVLGHYVRSIRCLKTRNVSPSVIANYNTQFKLWLVSTVVPRLQDEKWYPAFGGILRVLRAVGEKSQNTTQPCVSRQIRKKRLVPAFKNFKNEIKRTYQNNLSFFGQQGTTTGNQTQSLNGTSQETKPNKIEQERYLSKQIATDKNEDKMRKINYFLNKQQRRFAHYVKEKGEQKKTSNTCSRIMGKFNDTSETDMQVYKLNLTNNATKNIILNKILEYPLSKIKTRNELLEPHRSNFPVELKAENLVDDDFVPIEEMILRKFMLPHPLKEDYVTSMSLWRDPVNWNVTIKNRSPRNEGGKKTSSTLGVSKKPQVHANILRRVPGIENRRTYTVPVNGEEIFRPAEIRKFHDIYPSNSDYKNKVFTLKTSEPKEVQKSEDNKNIPRKRKLKYSEAISSLNGMHSSTDKTQSHSAKPTTSHVNKHLLNNRMLMSKSIGNIESALVHEKRTEDQEVKNQETSFITENQRNYVKDMHTICISTCVTVGDCENLCNNKGGTKPIIEHNVFEKTTPRQKPLTQKFTPIVNMDLSEYLLQTTMSTSSDHRGVKISKGVVYHQANKITVKQTALRTKKTNMNDSYYNKKINQTLHRALTDYNEANNIKMGQPISNEYRASTQAVGLDKLSAGWPAWSQTSTFTPNVTPMYTGMFGIGNRRGEKWVKVTDTCIQRIWDGRHAASPLAAHFLCDILQSPILNLDFYAYHIIITIFIWLLLFCASIGNDDMQWRWGFYCPLSSCPLEQVIFPRDPYQRETHSRGIYPRETHPSGTYPRETRRRERHPRETYPRETYPRGSYPSGTYPRGTYPSETPLRGIYPRESSERKSYPREWYPREPRTKQTPQRETSRKEQNFSHERESPNHHTADRNRSLERDSDDSYRPRRTIAPIAALMDHRFRCIPWREKGTIAEKTPLYSTSKSTTFSPSTSYRSQPIISSDSQTPPKNQQHTTAGKKPPVNYLMSIKSLKISSESEAEKSEDEQHTIDEP